MEKHQTLDPLIIRLSLTGDNFFAAVKSFDANIAISGNFALNAKNSLFKQLSIHRLKLNDINK